MILATLEHFRQPLIQARIGKGRSYNLGDDYCFQWEENGFLYRRTVFMENVDCGCLEVTDLASVPRIGNALGFDNAGESDGGAVIHDHDYASLGRKKDKDGNDNPGGFNPGEFQIYLEGEWVDCSEPYTRARSDWWYYKRCVAGGMSKWKAWIEYAALRVGAINPKNKTEWYFS